MLEVDQGQVVEGVRAAVRGRAGSRRAGCRRRSPASSTPWRLQHLEVELQVLAGLPLAGSSRIGPSTARTRSQVSCWARQGLWPTGTYQATPSSQQKESPTSSRPAGRARWSRCRGRSGGAAASSRRELLELGLGGHQAVGAAVDRGHLAAEARAAGRGTRARRTGRGRGRPAAGSAARARRGRRPPGVGADRREVPRQVGGSRPARELGLSRRRGDLVEWA